MRSGDLAMPSAVILADHFMRLYWSSRDLESLDARV